MSIPASGMVAPDGQVNLDATPSAYGEIPRTDQKMVGPLDGRDQITLMTVRVMSSSWSGPVNSLTALKTASFMACAFSR